MDAFLLLGDLLINTGITNKISKKGLLIMNSRQKKDLIILIFSFLTAGFIFNGFKGSWSIVRFFKEDWATLLGMTLIFSLTAYLSNKYKK